MTSKVWINVTRLQCCTRITCSGKQVTTIWSGASHRTVDFGVAIVPLKDHVAGCRHGLEQCTRLVSTPWDRLEDTLSGPDSDLVKGYRLRPVPSRAWHGSFLQMCPSLRPETGLVHFYLPWEPSIGPAQHETNFQAPAQFWPSEKFQTRARPAYFQGIRTRPSPGHRAGRVPGFAAWPGECSTLLRPLRRGVTSWSFLGMSRASSGLQKTKLASRQCMAIFYLIW